MNKFKNLVISGLGVALLFKSAPDPDITNPFITIIGIAMLVFFGYYLLCDFDASIRKRAFRKMVRATDLKR